MVTFSRFSGRKLYNELKIDPEPHAKRNQMLEQKRGFIDNVVVLRECYRYTCSIIKWEKTRGFKCCSTDHEKLACLLWHASE